MYLSKQVKQMQAYIQTIEIPHRLPAGEAGKVLLEKKIPLSGIKEDTKILIQAIDGSVKSQNSL